MVSRSGTQSDPCPSFSEGVIERIHDAQRISMTYCARTFDKENSFEQTKLSEEDNCVVLDCHVRLCLTLSFLCVHLHGIFPLAEA